MRYYNYNQYLDSYLINELNPFTEIKKSLGILT